MNILKLSNCKFSIVLTLAIAFIVITTNASAQTRHPGGMNVVFSDGSVKFLSSVTEVRLPNSPLEYDRVDAQDPNAAIKIRMLLEAAQRMRSGIVVVVPKNSINVPARFRLARLIVGDEPQNRTEYKLKDVLVTSYQVSGSTDSHLDYLVISLTN